MSRAPFLQPLPGPRSGLGPGGRSPALPWGEAPWRDGLSRASFAAPPPRRPPRVLQTAFFRTRNGRFRSVDARCDVAVFALCGSHGSGWRRCGPAAAALIATHLDGMRRVGSGHADRVWHDNAPRIRQSHIAPPTRWGWAEMEAARAEDCIIAAEARRLHPGPASQR